MIEVVAGIIINNNQILCMQRPDGKHKYTSFKYEFPGGKIEKGESNEDALKRELIEELEMEVEIKDYFMTITHKYPDFEIKMHSYICYSKTRDFVMKEHVDYKWLNIDELNTLDWADADVPIKDKIISDKIL